MRPLNFEFVLTLVGSVSACSLIRFSYVATLSRFHYFIKRCSLVSHIHVKLRNIMSFQTDDAKQQKSVSCVVHYFSEQQNVKVFRYDLTNFETTAYCCN